jgi:flagellar hook capping protein FlgD
MRRTPRVAVALAVLALLAPAAARRAAAQLADVYHEGLAHAALGGAVVTVDPATRRLPVQNLGSSGQDGVEIKWARGAHGYAASLPDAETDFATPGCVHTIVVSGTSGGAAVVVGRVAVTRNSDGSETLKPDFTSSHATNTWVDLLDANGKVIYSSCCKNAGYDLKMAKKVLAAARPVIETAHQKWIECDMRSPAGCSIEIAYPVAMLAYDGPTTVECYAVRFGRKNGDALSDIGPVAIKGMWPVGTGPGSFTIDLEPVTPPCAGLDCPNGPGTELRVVGEGQYELGPYSNPQMKATPKDTSRVHLRESPSKASLGRTGHPPVKRLTMVISDPAASGPAGSQLLWHAEGTVDGVPDQELCSMTCTIAGGQSQYVPDFSAFGDADYRVVLSNGGTVVADVVDPVGGFTVQTSSPDEDIEVARTIGGPRIIRNCRTPPCPGEPVIVNGAVYVADHIEIDGIDNSGSTARSIDDITALELSSYDALTIYGGYADPVTPLAGVEGPAAALDFGRPVLSPNPALGPVRVQFALPQAGRARVSVTDVLGRRVRGLLDSEFAAGTHSITWDGRTEAGRRAPAGVYFVRVESAAHSAVTRLTRLW